MRLNSILQAILLAASSVLTKGCSSMVNPLNITPSMATGAHVMEHWQPVNAGINPAFKRWQSSLGTLTIEHSLQQAATLDDLNVTTYFQNLKTTTAQGFNGAGWQILRTLPDEKIQLAGQSFWHTKFMVQDPAHALLHHDMWVGISHGQIIRCSLELSSSSDKAAYITAQRLLTEKMTASRQP